MLQRVTVLLVLMSSVGWSGVTESAASEPQQAVQRLSRYQISLLGARHEQRDLLVVPVAIEFGDEVRTVGEAIALLIEGSGYRMAEVNPEGLCRQAVLKLPLPRVHRELAGLTLRQALEVLLGPGYLPLFDQTKRLLSIERVQREPAIIAESCVCE